MAPNLKKRLIESKLSLLKTHIESSVLGTKNICSQSLLIQTHFLNTVLILAHILEVKEAKERLRLAAQRELVEAMHDVSAWATLDGIGFERAVAIIYREQGFNVEFTSRTNDRGVDLILRKGGTVSIVQCKAYAKSVGVSAVRELIGTRAAWPNPTEAILVALFDFSGAAKSFAAEHNIKLYSVAREYLKTDYRPGL